MMKAVAQHKLQERHGADDVVSQRKPYVGVAMRIPQTAAMGYQALLQGSLDTRPAVQQLQAYHRAVSAKLEVNHVPLLQRKENVIADGDVASTNAGSSALVNQTGLPDMLKSGLEQLSGMDLSSVRVHYNSPAPAQLSARAYTQGSDIHIGPGQEKHLGHEGWHVVQQMQGRVKPTLQMQGMNINDSVGLEAEADRYGARAWSLGKNTTSSFSLPSINSGHVELSTLAQRQVWHPSGSMDVAQFNGKDKVKKQYQYLDDDDQEKYSSLATDVRQELFKNSDLVLSESAKFSPETEKAIMEMLSSMEGLHFGSNPELGKPWQQLVDSYSGSKSGAPLYSHIRSPGFTKVLKTFDINWSDFAKSPEIHHLIYKKEEPKSAVAPWNLMLATRGSSSKKVVGQHEGMMHLVSSPPGRPNISQSVYLNEVPGVKGVVRRWARDGERPVVKMSNPLYQPAYDIFPQMGMGSNPFGSPTLSYMPEVPLMGPDLWTAQRDNRIFAQPEPEFLFGDEEHGHWSDWGDTFDTIMMTPSPIVDEWSLFSSMESLFNPYQSSEQQLPPLFPQLTFGSDLFGSGGFGSGSGFSGFDSGGFNQQEDQITFDDFDDFFGGIHDDNEDTQMMDMSQDKDDYFF